MSEGTETSTGRCPLAGVRVLEWGDFAAVPFAARLLADAGAEVVKVESPSGDSARRAGPFPGDQPDPDRSGLFTYLNRGKRAVTLDLATDPGVNRLRRLLEGADVFLHERPSLVESPLGVDGTALRKVNPRLVVVSLTPFGERGPRSRDRADDLVISSASGITHATPGYPDYAQDLDEEPPLRPNANIAELTSGLVAATGAMLALHQRDHTGVGLDVEISKQEALISMLLWDLGLYTFGGLILGRRRIRGRQAPNHYLPVADGWAAIVAYRDYHWQTLVELMGSPEWAADPRFASPLARGEHWDDLEPLLLSWLLDQPKRAILDRVQSRGIPSAPALTIREAIENENTVARQFLVPSGIPGDTQGRLPSDVYVVDGLRRETAASAPRLASDDGGWKTEDERRSTEHGRRTLDVGGDWADTGNESAPVAQSDHVSVARSPSEPRADTRARADTRVRADTRSAPTGSPPRLHSVLRTQHSVLPLSGIRIVDFGQIVAMPLAGQWLAMLGAEVILVESRTTGLPSRAFAPFKGEPKHETSNIFNQVNRNKRSCTLNIRTAQGADLARRLIATADVVLENFSPGTLEKLGLGYESLREAKPDLIMVSLSACGSDGPWRNFAALHSGIIALSGLSAVTGYEGGHPRIIGAILPDPIAATYCALAVLQALYVRRRTGQGQDVELAMTETIQSMLPEVILEYTMLGREPEQIGNRHPFKAPHGIYRTRGEDRWVAISVATDAEWRGLCRVVWELTAEGGRTTDGVTGRRGDGGRAGERAGGTGGEVRLGGDRAGTPLDDPRFATLADRLAHVAALDAAIGAWTMGQEAPTVAAALQRAGVAATVVFNARDILEDAHLAERGFIVTDEHPLAGPIPMTSIPWQLHGLPPLDLRHAPVLGADNGYVLGEILGLTPEEIAQLESAGVVH
ncbi:MAG: CoA transferase [Chloroflexi bacterium]|nr:CoA transferase [Chloroflexota bacterium]